MTKKQYSIVRVDKFCPRDLERNYNLKCVGSLHCDKCDLKKNYGDSKRQLVMKIAQVLRTKRALFGIKDKQLAKEIIEFLGVE